MERRTPPPTEPALAVAASLPMASAPERPPGFERLTPRELEVIRRICHRDQWTYKAIAVDMHIHRGSLQDRIASIFLKLKVNNRGGLVLLAVRGGFDR